MPGRRRLRPSPRKVGSPLRGKYLFTYDGWFFYTDEAKRYTKEELASQNAELVLYWTSSATGRTTYRVR
jgi:hypothetical protein